MTEHLESPRMKIYEEVILTSRTIRYNDRVGIVRNRTLDIATSAYELQFQAYLSLPCYLGEASLSNTVERLRLAEPS